MGMYRMHSKFKSESGKIFEGLEDLKGEFNEEVKRRKREKSESVSSP